MLSVGHGFILLGQQDVGHEGVATRRGNAFVPLPVPAGLSACAIPTGVAALRYNQTIPVNLKTNISVNNRIEDL